MDWKRTGSGIAAAMMLVLAACGGGAFDPPAFDLPDPVQSAPMTRESPAIAMAANGKATCVWVGDDHVYAERYLPGYGWTDFVRIDDAPAPTVEPEVAMDPQGDAVVVWTQDGQVVANCFEVGSGWQGAQPLSDPEAPPASTPQLGSAGDGCTVVVWEEGGDVVAAILEPGSGWQPPVPIAQPPTPARDVDVVVTPAGDAVVAWEEAEGVVATSTLDGITGTWSPPVVVGQGENPQVAANDLGQGIIVFEQGDDVAAATHDPLDGWQPPVVVPVPPTVEHVPAKQPQVDLGANGTGGIVFEAAGAVLGSTVDATGAVTPAVPISPSIIVAPNVPPQIAVDDDGNALAVFEDATGRVKTVTYRGAYDTWDTPENLGRGETPVVDVNPQGEAISVFITNGGIGASRIDDLDPTLPVRVSVQVHGSGRIASNPAGLDCSSGASCRMNVPMGTSVILTATPEPGFQFEHWVGIGATPITTHDVEVVATTAHTIEAVFVPIP